MAASNRLFQLFETPHIRRLKPGSGVRNPPCDEVFPLALFLGKSIIDTGTVPIRKLKDRFRLWRLPECCPLSVAFARTRVRKQILVAIQVPSVCERVVEIVSAFV